VKALARASPENPKNAQDVNGPNQIAQKMAKAKARTDMCFIKKDSSKFRKYSENEK
jgi:hypothetical protein